MLQLRMDHLEEIRTPAPPHENPGPRASPGPRVKRLMSAPLWAGDGNALHEVRAYPDSLLDGQNLSNLLNPRRSADERA